MANRDCREVTATECRAFHAKIEEADRKRTEALIAPLVERTIDLLVEVYFIPQLCGPMGRVMP